jgi:flagellar hook-basal body complex protein FliE
MGLLGDIASSIGGALGLDQLWAFVLKKFPAIQKLLDLATKVIEHFTGVFDAAKKLFDSAEAEFQAWRHFKQDVRFRQRVIVIEQALTKLQTFIQKVIAAWKEILSLIKGAAFKLETGGAAEIAEAATGIGLPIAIVNAIVIVVEVLDTIRNLIDTAQDIIDVIAGVREFIQGDFLFLQQKNPRKTEKLETGKSIKIRVGKLHASA